MVTHAVGAMSLRTEYPHEGRMEELGYAGCKSLPGVLKENEMVNTDKLIRGLNMRTLSLNVEVLNKSPGETSDESINQIIDVLTDAGINVSVNLIKQDEGDRTMNYREIDDAIADVIDKLVNGKYDDKKYSVVTEAVLDLGQIRYKIPTL